jgi:pimeloyl-ACP methyl ester carboxylesterase
MAIFKINDANLNYEVLGDGGPWLAFLPGGRHEMGNVRSLAERMARQGYRVLIHDRRNCGASDVSFDGSRPEYEIWADDLHALLAHLGGLPVVLGGGSSGCRLSLVFALKYPDAVRGLLLWRVTGGAYASGLLVQHYYDEYIDIAQRGGMSAVADSEHFRALIRNNPSNRERLLSLDPHQFIDAMKKWRTYFLASSDQPIIGVTEQQLGSIKAPTCIISGNDRVHTHAAANSAHRLIPGSEFHDLWPEDLDVDSFPTEDWAAREAEQAAIYRGFLGRNGIA